MISAISDYEVAAMAARGEHHLRSSRCVAYVRGGDPAAQRASILAYAQAHHLHVDDWFIDDGSSRSDLDRLKAKLETGEVGKILVHDATHLTRDPEEVLRLLEQAQVVPTLGA